MSSDPDLLALDDLPDDARVAIDCTERTLTEIRARADRRVAVIQEEAERECDAIRERAATALGRIEQEATRELAPVVRDLVDGLRAMQERYAREGKLDEALAIRARVRQLRSDLLGVRPDPGNLTEFGVADIGRVMLIDAIGRADGSVWGSDVYTTDSRLAAAAVHAGALRDGERGLVRVTILDGENRTFEGSTRHGVMTYDYTNYPLAFRIEKL